MQLKANFSFLDGFQRNAESTVYSEVKIDQSFVRDVLVDANDAAIARTILSLARNLDLEVVAEGVETGGGSSGPSSR